MVCKPRVHPSRPHLLTAMTEGRSFSLMSMPMPVAASSHCSPIPSAGTVPCSFAGLGSCARSNGPTGAAELPWGWQVESCGGTEPAQPIPPHGLCPGEGSDCNAQARAAKSLPWRSTLRSSASRDQNPTKAINTLFSAHHLIPRGP